MPIADGMKLHGSLKKRCPSWLKQKYQVSSSLVDNPLVGHPLIVPMTLPRKYAVEPETDRARQRSQSRPPVNMEHRILLVSTFP